MKYNRIKYTACLAFFVCLFSTQIKAQTLRISGTVSDTDGLPLELVSIQQEGTANGTLTDETGSFTLRVPAKDTCTLVFSCLGYNTTKKRIARPEEGMRMTVVMRSLAIAFGEVTIRAQRLQTNTLEKIDFGKAKLMADAAGGNIESLLATQAGVSSTNELSAQYSVRGGSYDENMVYVNGIEVYRPLLIRSGQQEGLSFINPDLTADVRFSSGGYDAKYGDKMASVLDIRYKKPTSWEGSLSGSLLGGAVYVGGAEGKWTQVTGLRYKRNTLLLGTLDTKGEYDPSFVDVQTYMTYRFTKGIEWNFLGNYSKNDYRFVPSTRSTSYGTLEAAKNFTVYFDGSERDRFITSFGSTGFSFKWGKYTELQTQLSAFQSIEDETYDISGEYFLSDIVSDTEQSVIGIGKYHEHARNHLQARVVSAQHSGKFKKNQHNLLWGVGMQWERVNDRIREWEMRDSAGYSLPYDGLTARVYDQLLSTNAVHSKRYSAYVQDTYKWRIEKGLLSFTAGLRMAYWDFNEELLWSPRFSLGFIPAFDQRFTFRLASGVYYQSPFYKEFRMRTSDKEGNSSLVLNSSIRSQRSIHLVLGGDYAFYAMDRPFKFTAETYYKKLDRVIPYTVDNVKIVYYGENKGSGYTAGVDLKLFGEFVPGTDSWLTFSLLKTEQDIDGKKVPLAADQRYSISLFFTDYFPKHKRIRMNMRAIWSAGLPFSAPDRGYEEGYFVAKGYRRIDLGMTYQLIGGDNPTHLPISRYLKNVYLGVDCFNLFDINNVNSYYWVSAIDKTQYAVPNYLTGRQLNLKLIVEF